jgi:hypothetical protein
MSDYIEKFQVEDGILHVRLSGTFPNELLSSGKNLFQPLIDACATHNCKKALIDARELRVNFNTMAMFQAGTDAAFLARVGLRIALLAREDTLDRFFENVIYNRSGDIRVFTDMDSASDWLRR